MLQENEGTISFVPGRKSRQRKNLSKESHISRALCSHVLVSYTVPLSSVVSTCHSPLWCFPSFSSHEPDPSPNTIFTHHHTSSYIHIDRRNGQVVLGRLVVHDRIEVEAKVLPRYFNHSSFASLRRQLNYFSFTRIGKGMYYLLIALLIVFDDPTEAGH